MNHSKMNQNLRRNSVARLAVLLAAGAASAMSFAQIKTTVDGTMVDFPDTQPTMINNRVMVPVRGVFEHLNATVDWEPQSETVTAVRGSDTIKMALNSYQAWVNQESITLDAPPTMVRGRTMVPLRFLSEALGAEVKWNGTTRTVAISTDGSFNDTDANYETHTFATGTVIPFALSSELSSNESKVGDKFTAKPTGYDAYRSDLPSSVTLMGHVNTAKPKEGKNPGVLGLTFDHVKLADGRLVPIQGDLIGLNSDSVEMRNGKLVAKPGAKKNNLKYVGYGAGAGALLSILGEGNLLTNTVIGAALGFLIGELEKPEQQPRDVVLKTNEEFGVVLTDPLTVRIPTDAKIRD